MLMAEKVSGKVFKQWKVKELAQAIVKLRGSTKEDLETWYLWESFYWSHAEHGCQGKDFR